MNEFNTNIICIYGDKGQKWLVDLPHIVNDIAVHWHLSDLKPVNNLSYNYVLSGFQETCPIMLKLGLDFEGLNTEASALKIFKECGAVEVMNQTDGAMLLERAIPGYSLRQFFPTRDIEAVSIVSEVIRKLRCLSKPSIEVFPPIRDWLISLDSSHEMLRQYLPKARALRDELLKTMGTPVLLHGDLHHDNILAHGAEWKVIDPKGVIGEVDYEVGCFIRNPVQDLPSHPDCLRIIMNRIDGFSCQLNLDPNRILKWCFVQSVLAAVWALEDNIDLSNFECLAEIFDHLLINT